MNSVEKTEFIYYYKNGFDNKRKGVQKMKVENYFREKYLMKYVSYKDIIQGSVSVLSLIIVNIQMFEITNLLSRFGIGISKFVFYNIFTSLVIISLTIYGMNNKRQSILNKMNIAKLEESNKNLLELNDNVRCFKHDFNNIIQAIDGYIVLKDMNALQNYFNKLVKECNHMNVIDILSKQLIDNPAIYGILLNKYKIATENNIQMNIDIFVSLNNFYDKAYTISRMLGILLDNALEATNECENKIINVQFMKEDNKNRTLIIVENTYENKDIDTNKIFDKHYTTKKDKGNTGLGLWKVRDILRKDTSLDLFTTKDDTMFKQQLEIYS